VRRPRGNSLAAGGAPGMGAEQEVIR
jgi:hypothetical protein